MKTRIRIAKYKEKLCYGFTWQENKGVILLKKWVYITANINEEEGQYTTDKKRLPLLLLSDINYKKALQKTRYKSDYIKNQIKGLTKYYKQNYGEL